MKTADKEKTYKWLNAILEHYVDKHKASKKNADKFGKWLVDKYGPIPADGEGLAIVLFGIYASEEEMEERINEYFTHHYVP